MIRCTFEDCSKTFACQSNLNDHINVHMGIKPFTCEICQKSFACKRYLRSHTQSHGSPVRCEQCGKLFTRKYKLKVHLEKYCLKTYKCSSCLRIYQKRGCYEKHKKTCGRQLDREQVWFKAPRERKPTKIFTCEICRAEYSGKRNLVAHVRARHENVRFKCKFCEKVFVYNCSRVKHMKRVHSESFKNT